MEEGHRITNDILTTSIANELSLPESDIVVVKFDHGAGSSKGDNYLCEMKAITVTAKVKGEEKVFHYMMKQAPMNEYRTQYLNEVCEL
jgi:hypothetical protein